MHTDGCIFAVTHNFQGGVPERSWMDRSKGKKAQEKTAAKQLKGKKKKVAKALSEAQDGLDPVESKELKKTAAFHTREAKRSRKLKRIRTVRENDNNLEGSKKKRKKSSF